MCGVFRRQGRPCNWKGWKDLGRKGQIARSLLVIERSWALTSGERNIYLERNIPGKGTYILEETEHSEERETGFGLVILAQDRSGLNVENLLKGGKDGEHGDQV